MVLAVAVVVVVVVAVVVVVLEMSDGPTTVLMLLAHNFMQIIHIHMKLCV